MRIVIVGGVAGGASAAARARRLSEDAEIVLIERGPDVSYANCGLPYYIGGEIKNREKLLVTSIERMRQRFRLDVRTQSNVEGIDRVAKKIRVKDLTTGHEYEEGYTKLILAPGAAPFKPDIRGIDLPNVFTLRTLEDMDRIKSAIDQKPKHATVVGAGFIGLEMVENLLRRGIAVSLVELQDQVLPPLDKEMTAPLVEELTRRGVTLHLSDSVESIQQRPDGLMVSLKSKVTLTTGIVVLGVGVRPENKLATDAGIEVGPRGGIRVNAHLQTSDPDIYAVGDAVETTDFVFGGPAQVPLAGPANRQGRIAAENCLGRNTVFRGAQGTAIVGFFDRVAAMTGASEKALLREKRPCRKIYVHPAHHAGYYPGAEAMTLKLLFDESNGRIFGAQGVGGAGVDKRIDVIAMAIQARMTVFDLEEVEMAYAPQFGSAKDPVNMAGFVAAGLLRGDHPQCNADELEDSDLFILDVRTRDEFQAGHIPSAVNIPVDELRDRIEEVPSDSRIVAYCQVGQRGYIATRLLMQAGRDVKNLAGGYNTYRMYFS